MKITTNNTIKLEKAYTELRRDGKAKKIDLNKNPVENAMGFEVELLINLDVILTIDWTQLLSDLFQNYLEYRLIKEVVLKKLSGETEVIDVEVLQDPKKLEQLNIEEDTELFIEYKER